MLISFKVPVIKNYDQWGTVKFKKDGKDKAYALVIWFYKESQEDDFEVKDFTLDACLEKGYFVFIDIEII